MVKLPSSTAMLAAVAMLGLVLHSSDVLAQARGSTPAVSAQTIIDALSKPPPPPPDKEKDKEKARDEKNKSRNLVVEVVPDYAGGGGRAEPMPMQTPTPVPVPPKPTPAANKPSRPGNTADLMEPTDWKPPALQAQAQSQAPSIDLALQFEFNSAKMTRDSQNTLAELAKALASPQLASMRFLVQGHTDGKGLAAYNMKLSQARAAEVKRLLVRAKIAASRLTAEGKGSTEPLDAANIEAPENRRVRIISLAR